jgi:hypothetical protein
LEIKRDEAGEVTPPHAVQHFTVREIAKRRLLFKGSTNEAKRSLSAMWTVNSNPSGPKVQLLNLEVSIVYKIICSAVDEKPGVRGNSLK